MDTRKHMHAHIYTSIHILVKLENRDWETIAVFRNGGSGFEPVYAVWISRAFVFALLIVTDAQKRTLAASQR